MKKNSRQAAYWKLEGVKWDVRCARWKTYLTAAKTAVAVGALIRMLFSPLIAEVARQILRFISH